MFIMQNDHREGYVYHVGGSQRGLCVSFRRIIEGAMCIMQEDHTRGNVYHVEGSYRGKCVSCRRIIEGAMCIMQEETFSQKSIYEITDHSRGNVATSIGEWTKIQLQSVQVFYKEMLQCCLGFVSYVFKSMEPMSGLESKPQISCML